MPKYDPYSRSLHEDPYPTYTELRGRQASVLRGPVSLPVVLEPAASVAT